MVVGLLVGLIEFCLLVCFAHVNAKEIGLKITNSALTNKAIVARADSVVAFTRPTTGRHVETSQFKHASELATQELSNRDRFDTL